jgi:hypothetical protein
MRGKRQFLNLNMANMEMAFQLADKFLGLPIVIGGVNRRISF